MSCIDFRKENVLILSNKKKYGKKNQFFKNEDKITSKNLADINNIDFNISNSRYMTYTNDNSKISNNRNIKGKSIPNILSNNDENDGSDEKVTSYTSQNLKNIKSRNLGKLSNEVTNISSVKRIKTKKRVKFKPNFSTIIEIESYKKYYANNYMDNKSNCVNCSCKIF